MRWGAQVIATLIFVLVGLAFCSLLIPLRLLLTVLVTVGVTAGLLVAVFQVALGCDGIYWIVPVCTAPLVIGLTLDYDLFVVSRVHEFRRLGFSTEASVVRALVKTGPVISAAGFIMVTAFSSMLLSKELVLNQFGFVSRWCFPDLCVCHCAVAMPGTNEKATFLQALVAASTVDTVVVRSFFVPVGHAFVPSTRMQILCKNNTTPTVAVPEIWWLFNRR